MKEISLILPSCWAMYLTGVLGACSFEAEEECKTFIQERSLGVPVSVSEDSWFAGYNDANTGPGNVCEYHFIVQ